MQLAISSMTEDDLEQVMSIERNSFRYPWSPNSFQREIQLNEYAYYIVAKEQADNLVIGYTGMWIIFEEAHITTMAVHPDFRRKGIATLLLGHILQEMKTRGGTHIFLEVRSSNYPAQKLYKKNGFIIGGRRKNYYCDEDAIVMVKYF